MSEGYPTEEQLDEIRVWDCTTVVGQWGLLKHVAELWTYPQFVKLYEDGCLEVSTAGWSGNEAIISALVNNQYGFWSLCWRASKAGGWTRFETMHARLGSARRVRLSAYIESVESHVAAHHGRGCPTESDVEAVIAHIDRVAEAFIEKTPSVDVARNIYEEHR